MKLAFMLSLALKATTLAQAQLLPLPAELRTLLAQANINYPLLKQQQLQFQAGDAQVAIAQTAKRPNALLTGTSSYVTPVPGITLPLHGQEVALTFASTHPINVNVSVGQTLCDFGLTDALIRLAADNAQITRRSYALTQHILTYQVAAAYCGVGFLQQAISVQDSVIKTAGATVRVLANRLQNGDALQYDVYSQQVRVKIAINRKIELQNQLERQLAALTYFTGNTQPVTSGSFRYLLEAIQLEPGPLLDLTEQLRLTAVGNPDQLLAQDRLKIAETDVLVSHRANNPTLTATGSAGIKNGYAPTVDQMRANFTVGINGTVPLYAGNRYTLQHQIAQLNRNASQYALESTQAQVRQHLTELGADIRSNQARLSNLGTQVLQAREALAIANSRWRNGLITTAELQSAQTGVEEAELSQLHFQYQLLLNQLELKRLLGEQLL